MRHQSYSKNTRPLPFKALSLGIVFALFFCGCEEDLERYQVMVEVRDDKSQAIDAAEVYIDRDLMGLSGADGKLSFELKVTEKTRVFDVKVNKDSPTHYFAPHYDRIQVALEQDPTVVITLSAVLYSVQKPGRSDQEAEDLTAKDDPAPNASTSLAQQQQEQSPQAQEEFQEAVVIDAKPLPLSPQSRDDLATDQSTAAKPEQKSVQTVNVYTFHEAKPVPDVEIRYSLHSASQSVSACKTNARGRCSFELPAETELDLMLSAQKKGFHRQRRSLSLKESDKLRFDLVQGHNLNVVTYLKKYDWVEAQSGVEVLINGQAIGQTDEFGQAYHTLGRASEELVAVELRAPGYLPSSFETDFITDGSAELVRYFVPQQAPSARMVLLDIEVAGKINNDQLLARDGQLFKNLEQSLEQHLFARPAVQRQPINIFESLLSQGKRSFSRMLEIGWADTLLKSEVDAMIRPTLSLDPRPSLELALIGSNGRMITAAQERLESLESAASIDAAVVQLTKKLLTSFPFEGAVTALDGQVAKINIGTTHQRGLSVGDVVEVYGNQTTPQGKAQLHRMIARMRIESMDAIHSMARVETLEPRSLISLGDLVILSRKQIKQATVSQNDRSGKGRKDTSILVRQTQGPSSPVHQANIYWNDQWVGATDAQGVAEIDGVEGSGELRIVRHGYKPYESKHRIRSRDRLNVSLTQETAMLRIETEPSQAMVRVDGKRLGKTPLRTAIAIPSGFVKLEIEPLHGYKMHTSILELQDGVLDLTASRAVKLQRDLRTPALRLIEAGRFEEAMQALEKIPEDHSDYLFAQHDIGDLYLTKLDLPQKAAETFARLREIPEIANFNDKRFVSVHINEGMARFTWAEQQLGRDPEQAAENLNLAQKILQEAQPYLRFVPEDQIDEARQNVAYYSALAQQRLWAATKDQIALSLAHKSWQRYIDQMGDAEQRKRTANGKLFAENAEIYLRQTAAKMDGQAEELAH